MGQPNLTINNGKETEFEFDVMIEGATAGKAAVRFIIEGVDGYDVAINCEQRSADKWLARIPPLELREAVRNFRVEVIAGDYFFCPTSGSMKVVSNPRVSMAAAFQKVSEERPVVRATVQAAQPERRLAVLESMAPKSRADLLRTCHGSGRIFARAGEVLQAAVGQGRDNLNPAAVAAVLETVRNAVKSVEAKVFL